MNNNTQQKRRTRGSPEQWSEIVDAWRASGLSVEDYAEQHDLGVHNLRRWVGRYREETQAPCEARRPRRPARQFLAVEVAQPQPHRPERRETDGGGTIEVAWPGGAIVRLSGDVDRLSLVAVMQALAEVTSC